MAPAILIFAIGFLPVHSIDRDAVQGYRIARVSSDAPRPS
jgi:hypothetical protein